MSALEVLAKKSRGEAEAATAVGLRQYEARRTWTRTDTGRWLNDRSEPVLAWLRRKPGAWPGRSRQVGYWMKEYAPRLFDKAHKRLAGGENDDAREAMLPGEVLR